MHLSIACESDERLPCTQDSSKQTPTVSFQETFHMRKPEAKGRLTLNVQFRLAVHFKIHCVSGL